MDLAIDRDTGVMHVLLERKSGDGLVWWAGEMPGWGTDVIAKLLSAGDEEGVISYDPEAEVLIEMRALPGMSGGGIYDERGLQVAIAVRASSVDIGMQYVRAVRMSHLVHRMNLTFTSLQAETQMRVSPYLESF